MRLALELIGRSLEKHYQAQTSKSAKRQVEWFAQSGTADAAHIAKLPELPGEWQLGLDSWAGRS
jgi:hypothetical protein